MRHNWIQNSDNKKTVTWKVGSMLLEYATELAKARDQSDFISIWQCANEIIKDIFYLEQTPLDKSFTVENIIEGEVKIFESLKEFIRFFTHVMLMSSIQGNYTG